MWWVDLCCGCQVPTQTLSQSLFSLHRDHSCSPLATITLTHQSFRQRLLLILGKQWELLNISILYKMRVSLCMMQHYYNRKAAEKFFSDVFAQEKQGLVSVKSTVILIYFIS